jgi:hypothetical protein
LKCFYVGPLHLLGKIPIRTIAVRLLGITTRWANE